MKLANYLKNKDADFKDVIAIIEKECAPYLNLLSSNGIKEPFFRAAGLSDYNVVLTVEAGDAPMPVLYYKSTRSDRRPRAMGKGNFKNFNLWLERNGHLRRDDTISTISSVDGIGIFGGKPSFVFPIGKCSFTFIKSLDLNIGPYKDPLVYHLIEDFPEETNEDQDELLNMNIITNKGLKLAYTYVYETWWKCKDYYMIPLWSAYYTGMKVSLSSSGKVEIKIS